MVARGLWGGYEPFGMVYEQATNVVNPAVFVAGSISHSLYLILLLLWAFACFVSLLGMAVMGTGAACGRLRRPQKNQHQTPDYAESVWLSLSPCGWLACGLIWLGGGLIVITGQGEILVGRRRNSGIRREPNEHHLVGSAAAMNGKTRQ